MINKKERAEDVLQPATSLERRDVPRFNIKEPGMLIIVNGNDHHKFAGKVLDISEQGLLINTKNNLQLDDKVSFIMKWPLSCELMEGTGRVIRTNNGKENSFYGIIFQNKEMEIQKLKRYLKEYTDQLVLSNRRKRERRQEQNGAVAKDTRRCERRNFCILFKKCSRFNRLEAVRNTPYYIYQREVQSGADRKVMRKGKALLNFASNNYLGLATHPALKAAAVKAIKKYGVGTTGARLLNGTTDLHTELEKRLAEFAGGESCMVCTTGFSLNISLVSALVSANTHVLIDSKVHASIVDGCFLSPAKVHVFKHNDPEDLKQKLDKIDHHNPKLMVIDGVYSMKGDLARLDELYHVAQKYAVAIMMDDAHGIGVLGKTGRGTAERFGLMGKVDLYVATLSKAFGCMGGFVVAKEKIIQYLKHSTRSYIFSASLPAAVCAASIKALEIVNREPERHEQLTYNINYLQRGLVYLGFTVENTESAIVPINIHDETMTYRLGHFLEQEGIFVNAFVYPAVKKGEAGLRISLQANHTEQDLDFLLGKLEKAKKHLELNKKGAEENYN